MNRRATGFLSGMRVPTESPSGSITVGGWGTTPHWGICAALLMASTALLTLEVSLTRLFSFTVWYHFAYLTISVALLGFGSSGAIVAAFPQLLRRSGHHVVVGALVGAALLTAVALEVLVRFPLKIEDLWTAPLAFSASLLGYYGIVGTPFFLAGFGISVPFAAYPRSMGRLYFWDLLGAALGCMLAVSCVEPLGIPGLIIMAAGLLLLAAAALNVGVGSRRATGLLVTATLLTVGLGVPIGNRLEIKVTATKAPATFRSAVKGEDTYTKWTALNRVDAAGWDHPTTMQYWLGAAMRSYRGPLPKVAGVTYDGSNGSNIYSFSGTFDDYAMLEHHLLRTPYIILMQPNVLVIGVGGGIDMMNAIKQGARHVTGVELQPQTVYLLKDALRKFTGGFYDRPDVTLLAGEGRHFVRKTDQTFDLIQITAVDTFAAQATGAYVLAESYLYTVEAAQDYLGHLSANGLVSMVVGDILYQDGFPPLITRLGLNSYRALERAGAAHPENHIMVVGVLNPTGNARYQDILVKKAAFTPAEVNAVKTFVESQGFDVLYAPQDSTRVTYPLTPVLGANEHTREQALEREWFDAGAVYDRNPFFYNSFKWHNFSLSPAKGLLMIFPGSFVGQLVLLLMLAQSLLLGTLLIVLPLLRGAREGLRVQRVLSYLGYFLALGVGFMFIEISFVQSFVLFLGSPTYALSVTIFSLLLFASMGSFLSTRLGGSPAKTLQRLVLIVAGLVVVYAFGLASLFDAFLHVEFIPRIVIAIAVQLPIGLTLGMFMPLGIACIAREHPRLVPWAWGINGVGSVVGTTLAVIIAMSWGFRVVALLAAALYVLGTTLVVRATRDAEG